LVGSRGLFAGFLHTLHPCDRWRGSCGARMLGQNVLHLMRNYLVTKGEPKA
jgi:hypothetical protein